MIKKKSFFERLAGGMSLNDEERELPVKPEDEGKGKDKDKDSWEEEGEEGQLAVDVYQNPDEIVIEAMIAGVKPEDLNVSITRDMVTIRGRRQESREVSEDNYFYKELYWGSFSRTVLLPHEIDIEASEASEKHGLLTITLPKVDKGKQAKLRVKSS